MPPPDMRGGRPSTKAGPTETVTATGTLSHARVSHGTVTEAELAAWLRLDRVSYEDGWRAGYRAGFDAGRDVGYGQAHAELERQWHGATAAWKARSGPPTEAEEWLAAWRAKHGPYRGGPVDYWTGRPIEQRGAA